jgi:hypothetical protein
MDKDFTLYEEALELKQLGFDEPCFMYYTDKGELYKSDLYGISAPTYSQAFRWFREKYGLYPDIHRIGAGGKFLACIENLITGNSLEMVMDEPVDYEEAELASLKKLIKIVKNK